jgi:hypothetical protein
MLIKSFFKKLHFLHFIIALKQIETPDAKNRATA